jgi:DNA-binding CsgD family transcriptional regulator
MSSTAALPQVNGGGASLVRGTERLYRSFFTAALLYSVAAAAWGVAEQPFNELYARDFWSSVIVGIVAFGLGILALWQRSALFELFRLHPGWLLAVAAIGIGVMWADGDMDSAYFWYSLTVLALCAVVADIRWTVGYAVVLQCGLVVGLLGVHGYSLSQLSQAGQLDTFGEQLAGYLGIGLVFAVPMEWLASYVAHIKLHIADGEPVAAGRGEGRSSQVVSALSAREVEVTALVADGMSNEEIAARLYLSPRTVQTHVANAMRKTTTRSRTELAVVALREGLLPAGQEVERAVTS